MMTNDQATLDANLLVYAFYPKAPQHYPARQTLDQAQDENARLSVTSQVLAEFYAVVTDPKRVNPALKPEAALQRIDEVRSLPGLAVLPLPVVVVDRWVSLPRRHLVVRKRIFDVQLVATMLANSIITLVNLFVSGYSPAT